MASSQTANLGLGNALGLGGLGGGSRLLGGLGLGSLKEERIELSFGF